ncbi:GTPase [uncultured Fusobacterium sp.]|uniref:GTPase family protein n=1 Tax=uncultured Fusobacterium sp. TaxID=159267 RepID=UPI00260E0518|nr:GTPase [uncultured Fusobacterium sp.]
MSTINKFFEDEFGKILKNKLKNMNINILIVGATGVGKNSTINVLFDTNKAAMGYGITPETSLIESYSLKNLTIWDTPGLGDGEKDEDYADAIIKKLYEKDGKGNYLIDLVLVIIDGSNRDFGTTYNLLENVIIPNIKDQNRILIAINKVDKIGKKFWDSEKNFPTNEGKIYLEEISNKIKSRIEEKTKIQIKKPTYYSTGILDEDTRKPPYNLARLLFEMVTTTPEQKRLILIDNVNQKQDWENNDGEKNYFEAIFDSLLEGIKKIVDFVTDKENLKLLNNIISFFNKSNKDA